MKDGRRTTALVDVNGLRTEFATPHGRVVAVDGVDLEVAAGEVLGLVGESGSGKSVTARSIMRMVPEPGEIVGGRVLVHGDDVLTMSEPDVRRLRGARVAMVFQDPHAALNPVMTVGAQIAEALTVHGVGRRMAKQRAVRLLEKVGIPEAESRAGQYPHQFSGGMKQRVVIAIALANEPDLLIADEPTTALDVTIQTQILDLVLQLRHDLGIGVLIITHDMGVVAETCTRVAVMYAGRIVEQGPVQAVLDAPSHPYTAALIAAMPRLDTPGLGRRLPAIPGTAPDPIERSVGCAFAPRCVLVEEQCRIKKPSLLPVRADQQSACFVAHREDGIAARVAEAAGPRDARPSAGHRDIGQEPTLVARGVRVDVGSSMGLFRRQAPVYAVDGVDLSIRPGETVGLVGESGSGKSTFAKALVGATPVAEGEILLDGVDVSSMRGDARRAVRRAVQYVFQDASSALNPRRTVRQSMVEAMGGREGTDEFEDRLQKSMLTVGLRGDHLDRLPHAFSGGQRQRIGIARAIAGAPRVLLLDEPVSALDMSVQAQIVNLLAEIQEELGLAYLFIAHDLSVVRHISDRVAVMYLGRIVESGPASQVYSAPRHPYTAALLSSSPSPTSLERARERIVLRGDLPSPSSPPSGCRFRTRCPIGPVAHPERQVCIEVDPRTTAKGPDDHVAACHFPDELTLT